MNKKRKKLLISVLFVILFSACSQSLSGLQINNSDGKTLANFQIEIADSPAEQGQGLQNREFLGDDQAMLFVFPDEEMRSFWMKDTLISLDMIFANSKKEIVSIQKNAQPCQKEPCQNYLSESPAQYVLEINGGLSDVIGIELGNTLDF